VELEIQAAALQDLAVADLRERVADLAQLLGVDVQPPVIARELLEPPHAVADPADPVAPKVGDPWRQSLEDLGIAGRRRAFEDHDERAQVTDATLEPLELPHARLVLGEQRLEAASDLQTGREQQRRCQRQQKEQDPAAWAGDLARWQAPPRGRRSLARSIA